MNPATFETLAIQAPIVLIFAGALLVIMRDQAKNNKQMLDTFMAYMKEARQATDQALEKRDDAINKSLVRIADCLDKHDDDSKAHHNFTIERWKALEK